MRLCANAAVVRAWNDLKAYGKQNIAKRLMVIELGSKFVKSAKLFVRLFPINQFPNVFFSPERNNIEAYDKNYF